MADQVLTRDGPAAVPMDYQVPQGGELIPLVVNATLDGSAVGTPFYGAVQIIAPSGRVMGTAITSSIAAGASASPTWFPRVGGGVVSSNAPGIILQGYGGTFPAADFTWSGPSFTLLSTGFPANSTFTKISATSALQYHLNGDFVPAGAPDVLSLALVVDGVIEENIFTHVSVAGDIISIAWSKIRGLGGSSRSPLAAGAHTFDVQVSSASNVGNKTILVSTSVDLSVIEYEP